jgi:hypothetical protein
VEIDHHEKDGQKNTKENPCVPSDLAAAKAVSVL